jgi:hypothetical protein
MPTDVDGVLISPGGNGFGLMVSVYRQGGQPREGLDDHEAAKRAGEPRHRIAAAMRPDERAESEPSPCDESHGADGRGTEEGRHERMGGQQGAGPLADARDERLLSGQGVRAGRARVRRASPARSARYAGRRTMPFAVAQVAEFSEPNRNEPRSNHFRFGPAGRLDVGEKARFAGDSPLDELRLSTLDRLRLRRRSRVRHEQPDIRKAPIAGAFRGADEGTRTLDLLHGKRSVRAARSTI